MKKYLLLLLALALVCVAGLAVMIFNLSKGNPLADERDNADVYFTVEHVVDGDTVIIEPNRALGPDDERRIRFLNIDTMEMGSPDPVEQCFAREARDLVENKIPAGTQIGLKFDVEQYDQYGRTLAFVFPPGADERDVHQSLNAMIAREGLADAVVYRPNSTYLDDIESEVDAARDAKRGMFDPDHHCY